MSVATNEVKTNFLNAQLRGVAYPLPTGTYIALHTADPEVGGDTATEVSTLTWPAYTRKHAENGGAIGSGWSVPALETGVMVSRNQIALAYNPNNGSNPVQVTHWSVWDSAAVGTGTMLFSKALNTPRLLQPGDIFVFPAQALALRMP